MARVEIQFLSSQDQRGDSWGTAKIRGAESFHGNVRGEVQVNFLALFASKPHIFMCGTLKLSGIVRANIRLNIAIPMLVLSLMKGKIVAELLRTFHGFSELLRLSFRVKRGVAAQR